MPEITEERLRELEDAERTAWIACLASPVDFNLRPACAGPDGLRWKITTRPEADRWESVSLNCFDGNAPVLPIYTPELCALIDAARKGEKGETQ